MDGFTRKKNFPKILFSRDIPLSLQQIIRVMQNVVYYN